MNVKIQSLMSVIDFLNTFSRPVKSNGKQIATGTPIQSSLTKNVKCTVLHKRESNNMRRGDFFVFFIRSRQSVPCNINN